MNERIKELRMLVAQSFDPMNPLSSEEYSKEFDHRFAELIIKECAQLILDTDYELVFVEDGMIDPSISDAMILAASDIKEHFGVE
jgi:uncharacterized metal-binding protein YceD (DUF177 family)